jgi:nitrite reductase/ring-hydroxylating ferredoxin subunit
VQYRPSWRDLRCPCHGASFNLRGWLANGRNRWREEGPYRGDEEAYPVELPPLARPKVKVAGGRILVWTARAPDAG